MAVYGEVLNMFPELIRDYNIFYMEPKIGGGYKERVPLTSIRGAFIREGASKMKVQGESRVAHETGIFYCFDSIPSGILEQGTYFEDDGQVMLIMNDQIYAREGGFSAYGVQLVPGLDGTQVENKKVPENIIMDYM